MLTARDVNGNIITIPENIPKERLVEWQANNYYCPCCAEELILKAGQIKIPHFAHKKTSACTGFSEPETEYHLLGKRQLFQWFVDNRMEAEMEPYLSKINKRPDILIHYKQQSYAIEFQCSPISEELFLSRTKSYQDFGINPIWILAEKRIKRKKTRQYSLSAFQWLFTVNTIHSPMILTFSPDQHKLYILEPLTPFSSRTTFSQFTVVPLSNTHPNILFSVNKTWEFHFIEEWRIKRKAWAVHSVKTANHTNPFFNELYKSGWSPAWLPSEIGLPVEGMVIIETSAVEWQGWIFMDCLQHKKIGSRIYLSQIYQAFQKRMANGQIRLRTLPLLPGENPFFPVDAYLTLLTKLKILEFGGKGIYIIKNKLVPPTSSVEYMQLENDLYSKLSEMIL
ncbi:competence protein CoiA [Bacillus cihuensis]|uniref:competence protein CoiA n=1 Tax=Bacillus cihuensis TaxID=1208599 RepID=UPI00041E3707|nr:competence protein CoiA family protein [Bacillus cihuensis]